MDTPGQTAGGAAASVAGASAGAAAASVAGAFKPEITFDDFAKIDLRVARVVSAEPHPKADKLIKLQLDDGSGVPRQICAGVRAHYTPESLVGKQIVIVANLAPRMLRGEESRGMLLAASSGPADSPDRAVVIVHPGAEIGAGSVVS